jgi:outer membrane protein
MLAANQGRSLLDKQFDVNGHVDYRALAAQRLGQSFIMKNEAIQFLPKVYAGYALSQQYVSEGANVWDVSGISANNNVFSSWNVSAKWDLFTSGRRLAKFQEEQIKLQEIDILLGQTAQALAIQQSTAKAEFQHALADYQLQSRNVTMAKSILDDTQVKLKAGMATSMAFTQVQSQYQQALSAQLSAAQQALNNHVHLEQALGQSTHSSLND